MEKNSILMREMEDCYGTPDYYFKEREYQDRMRRGPVPVVMSGGSMKECVIETRQKDFAYYEDVSYDEMRRNAKNSFEVELWDECERLEQEENIPVEHYSLIRPEVLDMIHKELNDDYESMPDMNFGLTDDVGFDKLFADCDMDFGVIDIEKPISELEKPKEKMVVKTAYDGLVLYMYLYSLGEVKLEYCDFDEILRVLVRYYEHHEIEFEIEEKLKLTPEIQRTIKKYFEGFFMGGGKGYRDICMIPNSIFFLTSSKEKYRDVFRLFENQRYAIFRSPLNTHEIQGNFLEVALHKLCMNEGNFNSFIVEDTSLSLEDLEYLGGPYIKEFISMGPDKFYDHFGDSSSLWVSACVGIKNRKTLYISVFGTCGQIGPPVVSNVQTFNSINYVEGKNVASDSSNWSKYHPRHKAMERLLLMMNRKDGGRGAVKVRFKDPLNNRNVRTALLHSGFYGTNKKARDSYDKILSILEVE